MNRHQLREALAAYAHHTWSNWMRYMIPKLEGPDAQQLLERWKRQMNTDYHDLPEGEKASDRVEAEQILDIINEHK